MLTRAEIVRMTDAVARDVAAGKLASGAAPREELAQKSRARKARDDEGRKKARRIAR